MSAARVARLLRVHGVVQGVWFRDWTVMTAGRLGVAGWVRNRRDGTVEIKAVGAADAVEALRRACLEGPDRAEVEGIEVSAATDDGETGFGRRGTV
ncbi:MAG: acylphosphatase [Roseitalea porphyridii]